MTEENMTDTTPATTHGVDLRLVIKRYLQDETSLQIATSLGIPKSTLNYYLLRDCADAWREAQVARALTAFDDAKGALDAAKDGLALARAREQVRTAQWELERLLKRIYGPSQEVTGKDGGPIQVQVVRFGDTFEGDAAPHTPVLPVPGKDGGS